ncbi:MAG: exo-alpha-sialidase [Clostridia bacterium]|nr:exo-alpha-sialidase [Clostridia bacterium]
MRVLISERICHPLPTANCHASTVLPLPDGTVLAAWFGGSREGRPDVNIWAARRTHAGWQPPIRISYRADLPHWNPVLHLQRDGTVRLFFKVGRHIASWRTFTYVSSDGGRSFSAPVALVPGDRGARGPVKNKCLRLSDGRLLAPASSESHGWHCFIDTSYDDGVTWQEGKKISTGRIAPILNRQNDYCADPIPMIQPTLWESAPGCVHLLARTAVGCAYRSDSEDFGATWCEAYPTAIPNNNSGLDLVRVPDGTLFLVCNPVAENWGERSPLTLSRSDDNGAHFRPVLTLEPERPGSEFSYPAIVAAGGKLYVTYTYERTDLAFRVIAYDF